VRTAADCRAKKRHGLVNDVPASEGAIGDERVERESHYTVYPGDGKAELVPTALSCGCRPRGCLQDDDVSCCG
jgi:hypothetical protein